MSNSALDALALDADRQRGGRALTAAFRFLGRFVAYPSSHAHVAHTLWVAHTHMMDVWDTTPRLAFLSAEPASGKTRALEVTELLVPNPAPTVNVSPAYLFRKVASEGGATILFDEIDTVFGPKAKDNEDIRGLLNAGHRRGATTGRCVTRGKEIVLEELPAYAAVALAGIGWLPDTILSRSIVVRMRRRHAGEQVESFRRRLREQEGWLIRDQLATFAGDAANRFTWPELPGEIVDRNADIWEPLIAVADAAGGDWPRLARMAAVALVAEAREVEPSLGVRLLCDLRTVFGNAREMPTKSVLAALHALEEAPWSDIRGKPLDERGLASRLRQYNVRSKTIRLPDGTTPKGYTRSDLADVWERYAPPSPATSATSATSATTGSERTIHVQDQCAESHAAGNPVALVADVADVALPAGGAQRCAHCDIPSSDLLSASVNGTPVWLHAECTNAYRHNDP